ncbi:dolichol-phosphate mannosyltransferase [Nannocystis exedens]|uniref:Dolichol-phosphate mannosyltransferase n=1 Tax=Nannocystis exedens TaxID=54 RepID=A0A1I1Z7E2_9BACT|nr:polyprenol monophosphomannose synthase [Nannocystis exedens]PCC75120.1 dolichyl-phosphate beta-D-mannosyltransferase [Nannocystis exedens]SFE27609.1 dolichol-phosphate mannosyltransferase [Nannocystis exedens]
MSVADSRPRPLVLLPTYNERDNVEPITAAILAALPDARVLIIDDGSPDGTGELADGLAAADARVHVLHRTAKEGLGRAYLAGIDWALQHPHDFTHIITMDADFSHDPAYLPGLLAAVGEGGADFAIGSRYVAGGGTRGWSFGRRLLSRGGGLYARTVLGLGLRDPTAGFVCYGRAALAALDRGAVAASGYGFQIEMKYRLVRAGRRARELPIVFPDRERGASKMTPAIALEAVGLCLRLRFLRRS